MGKVFSLKQLNQTAYASCLAGLVFALFGHTLTTCDNILCCSVSAALLQMNRTMGLNCGDTNEVVCGFAVDVEDH